MTSEEIVVAGFNIDEIGCGDTKIAKIINTVQTFNTSIMRILKLALVKLPDSPQLNSIKRLVLLSIKTNPDIMIKSSYERFIEDKISNAVCDRDLRFFINHDYSDDIKKTNKIKGLYKLLNIIKKELPTWSNDEQEHIWELAYILVHCSSMYNILSH